jgi:hypothetical protein
MLLKYKYIYIYIYIYIYKLESKDQIHKDILQNKFYFITDLIYSLSQQSRNTKYTALI